MTQKRNNSTNFLDIQYSYNDNDKLIYFSINDAQTGVEIVWDGNYLSIQSALGVGKVDSSNDFISYIQGWEKNIKDSIPDKVVNEINNIINQQKYL